MRTIIALLNPWIVFLHVGRVGTAVLCLLLQLTIVGWIPAAVWAYLTLRREAAKPRRLTPFNIIPGPPRPTGSTA